MAMAFSPEMSCSCNSSSRRRELTFEAEPSSPPRASLLQAVRKAGTNTPRGMPFRSCRIGVALSPLATHRSVTHATKRATEQLLIHCSPAHRSSARTANCVRSQTNVLQRIYPPLALLAHALDVERQLDLLRSRAEVVLDAEVLQRKLRGADETIAVAAPRICAAADSLGRDGDLLGDAVQRQV